MTRVGVLGTGMVGRALAGRLVEVGHEVRMGARSADNEAARSWAVEAGDNSSSGDFADAAGFGEIVFNATSGAHSLDALRRAGAAALADKVLIDVANPLAPGPDGMALAVANTDSLAEQIQRAFPDARVVKTLNTMNCQIMIRPDLVPGDHVVFVCGEDADARQSVKALLGEFGWPAERILDLGGLSAARATEAWLLLWIRLWQTLGSTDFNLALPRAGS